MLSGSGSTRHYPPTISPAYGCFYYSQYCTISGDAGSTIYYTLDGSTPTTGSTVYSSGFYVSSSTTVKAIAVLSGVPSAVTTSFIQIDPYSAPVTQSYPVLWLKADNGVTVSGSNVTAWQDMTSYNNSASQSTSGLQPTFTSSAANGLPAVTFNGSQYMTFGPGFAGFSGCTIFLVTNPTSVSAGATFFDFGNGGASNDISATQPSSTDLTYYCYNGSTPTSLAATSAVTTGQYQLITIAQDSSGNTTISTNTSADASGSMHQPSYTTRSNNYLGTDASTTYSFNGSICELIVIPNLLSASQTQKIQAYLYARYGILVDPPSITPAFGCFSSTQTVSMTGDPGCSMYYTTNGSTPSNSSTPYTGAFNVSSSTTVKAIAYQTFGNSAVSQSYVQIDPNVADMSSAIPYAKLWLKADNGVTTSSSKISSWQDLITGGYAVQSNSTNQPTLTSSVINGLPGAQFDGSTSFMQLPSGYYFGDATNMFVVVKPSSVSSGARIIELGNGASNNNMYLSEDSSTSFSFYSFYGSTPNSISAPVG